MASGLRIHATLRKAQISHSQWYAPVLDTYACAWTAPLLRRVHGKQNDYYIADRANDADADHAAAAGLRD